MAELSFAIALINDGSGNYTAHAIASPAVRASGGTRLTTQSYNQNSTQTEAAKSITNATNATPIVITSAGHGYSNGDVVLVTGVAGNTAANGGPYIVESSTTNTFALQDSVGNAPWTSGGYVQRIARSKNFSEALMTVFAAVQDYKAAGN